MTICYYSKVKLFVAIHDYSYALYLKIYSYFQRTPHTEAIQNNLPTIILVPGVYENWFYFSHLQTALKRAGYQIIHWDLVTKSRSISEDSQTLSEFVEANGLRNVVLVGHSSGGLTALYALNLNPDRFKQVIAIAAPFAGVSNGRILRTKLVRELLPSSQHIRDVKSLSKSILPKVSSVYPEYDNQVWSKEGSVLKRANNYRLNTQGHHLILKGDELIKLVLKLV